MGKLIFTIFESLINLTAKKKICGFHPSFLLPQKYFRVGHKKIIWKSLFLPSKKFWVNFLNFCVNEFLFDWFIIFFKKSIVLIKNDCQQKPFYFSILASSWSFIELCGKLSHMCSNGLCHWPLFHVASCWSFW